MNGESHIPLLELVLQLEQGVRKLQAGELSKNEIESLHFQSRELHERFTVLRFKALEEKEMTIIEPIVIEPEPEEIIIPKISLSNNQTQTDLISAIEEVTSSVDSIGVKSKNPKSLAESHQSKPISSVGEGLTILERANYTSTLFSNDGDSFNEILDTIDSCSNMEDAIAVFNSSLKPHGIKKDIETTITSFEKRISRRFKL